LNGAKIVAIQIPFPNRKTTVDYAAVDLLIGSPEGRLDRVNKIHAAHQHDRALARHVATD
jgi:hypothetical protein